MKEMTEAERRFHLANCCQWKFGGYDIDDVGMPKSCTLVNMTNPYLPHKVLMVPKRTCHKVPGKMGYKGRKVICSECGYGLGDSRWYFCPKCGAEICGAEVVDD